jgi:hypothetical protein
MTALATLSRPAPEGPSVNRTTMGHPLPALSKFMLAAFGAYPDGDDTIRTDDFPL